MRNRRHHNNKGLRQIKRGKTREQIKRIARKLGIRYAKNGNQESKLGHT